MNYLLDAENSLGGSSSVSFLGTAVILGGLILLLIIVFIIVIIVKDKNKNKNKNKNKSYY